MKVEKEIRAQNHKQIEITVKDSKDAQVALNNAMGVLTSFYKESGMIPKEPWEFVQTGSVVHPKKHLGLAARDVELPESPSTWDSSYTGTTDPQNGDDAVLTLLNGVLDKFTQMEADATAQDATDQKNYE